VTDFSRSRLSDGALIQQAHAHLSDHRTSLAALLADLAEIDARRLYVAAGYSSMHAWCMGELRMSDDAVDDRIHAARAAREFPALLPMVADGRLHLSAVLKLAPHLNAANASDLLAAAAGRTKAQVVELLASRYPRTELMSMVIPQPDPAARMTNPQPVPERVTEMSSRVGSYAAGSQSEQQPHSEEEGPTTGTPPADLDARWSGSATPSRVAGVRARVEPIAMGRYTVQFTIGTAAHEKLEHLRALLSHAIPSGDLAEVFERALDVAISEYEKRKYGVTDRPRGDVRRNGYGRHIPAHVRRAVVARDGYRCTFVSASGHRCEERRFLELDHIVPFADGGRPTVGNLRLLCWTHNQYAAEQVFGTAFMDGKRQAGAAPAGGARTDLDVEVVAQADAREGASAPAPSEEEPTSTAETSAAVPSAAVPSAAVTSAVGTSAVVTSAAVTSAAMRSAAVTSAPAKTEAA
jgi:5-methylcytosine-specific restriction endonuclease McrA